MELSSFQLQDLGQSPHVAVVLNIAPNHLDVHPTFEEYVNAKGGFRTRREASIYLYGMLNGKG